LISDGKRSLRDDFIIEITNYPREEEIYSHELPHAIIFFGDQLSHVNIHPKPSLLDNEVSYVHVPSKPSKPSK